MVLDPVSALSIAASVVQFIDFGTKLISKSRELARNSTGTLGEHGEMIAASNRLKDLDDGLLKSLSILTAEKKKLTEAETALRAVSQECRDMAAEFSQTLSEYSVEPGQNAWKSFRKVFKAVWDKEGIEAMRQRDSQYQILEDLRGEGKRVEASILDAVRQSSTELQSTLAGFARQFAKNPRKHQLTRLKADRDQYISKQKNAIDRVSSDIHSRINEDSSKRLKEYILSTLYFTQIRERRSQIRPAHRKTFDWIFRTSDPQNQLFSNFREWLEGARSARGLYWISGKPGSGKSTLMRYWSEDERTKNALAVWAHPKSILYASCFFWLAGTETQKSLNGSLRSLLHDLLTQVPSLIPEVAPWRWRAADFGSNLPPWTNSELLEAFHELVAVARQTHCLFIFIDGLDEFHGDPEQQTELLALLASLSKSDSIKLCVSSRRYPIFQTAFEGFPTLRLENLTRNDIKIFVEGRLGDLKAFRPLQQIYPQESNELVLEIVKRAQGVFLWVHLVVRLSCQGVIDGDSMTALSRRLEEIPDDLDEFFRRIIDGIPRQQRKYASRYFTLMLASTRKPPLLSLFFVDEEVPDFVEKTPLQVSHIQSLQARQRVMERRLESRCRGLLEARKHDQNSWPPIGCQTEYYVDFLHRSVRDFLLSKDTQSVLHEYSSGDFDPNDFLCKATLAQLKMADSQLPDVLELSIVFLEHVRELERSSGTAHPRLFDTFTSLLKHHAPHWPSSPGSYVALALAFSVEHYATHMIRTGSLDMNCQYECPLIPGSAATLLEYSIGADLPSSIRNHSLVRGKPLGSAATALLEHGANPNSQRGARTDWKFFLRSAEREKHLCSELDPSWARIARAFVEHGAGREATQRRRVLHSRRALQELDYYADVLEMVFEGHEGKEYAAILRENSSTLGGVKRIFARSPRR
ncbi:hypothetical protein A1O7_05846 [Cladophialophora yegresii CBS 114405]|uniref:Uncharacterized protein n=1 Tax=Cladophialophora yegresii CBS 114405 TaxID=1182544 RepID=W9W1N8_9EURO|nr:uncharacterized protein A1O7_05846 [Cladophialophora yegresii CBS 114405]EXJ58421.1 hypothetical protein A1O7_05846 [Cladophialophora yegresii CBS 114405]